MLATKHDLPLLCELVSLCIGTVPETITTSEQLMEHIRQHHDLVWAANRLADMLGDDRVHPRLRYALAEFLVLLANDKVRVLNILAKTARQLLAHVASLEVTLRAADMEQLEEQLRDAYPPSIHMISYVLVRIHLQLPRIWDSFLDGIAGDLEAHYAAP